MEINTFFQFDERVDQSITHLKRLNLELVLYRPAVSFLLLKGSNDFSEEKKREHGFKIKKKKKKPMLTKYQKN